jgi:polysaccharide biosynthesis PFTS motif protein
MKTRQFLTDFFNACTEPSTYVPRKRAWAVMRGYRIMRDKQMHNFVKNIRAELTLTPVKLGILSMPFMPAIKEIYFRQYLLLILIGTRLNASILASLHSHRSIVFPLPENWAKVLQNNGVLVNRGLSRIIYFLFAFKQLLVGFYSFCKTAVTNLTMMSEDRTGKFIYFSDMLGDALPPKNGSFSYNVVEWYANWADANKSVTKIRHSIVSEEYSYREFLIQSGSLLPSIKSIAGYASFLAWGVWAFIVSFISLILGSTVYAILYRELIKEKVFSLADREDIAEEYYFNNGNMIYRPIWTYTAEQKGAKIILLNWSAGFPDILGPQGYPACEIGQVTQTWPYILQWSPLYSRYLESIIEHEQTVIKVVTPIYFCDTVKTDFKSDKPLLAVFDVTPQRAYFHNILVPSTEYRTYENGRKFLEDIYEVAKKNNFNILWKRKRSFIPIHSKPYIKFCERFSLLPGVIECDPRISAFQIVQQVAGVISMPFTSTALVADSYARPSVYYDPTQKLFKTDRGTQQLPLISGKQELNDWLTSLQTEAFENE